MRIVFYFPVQHDSFLPGRRIAGYYFCVNNQVISRSSDEEMMKLLQIEEYENLQNHHEQSEESSSSSCTSSDILFLEDITHIYGMHYCNVCVFIVGAIEASNPCVHEIILLLANGTESCCTTVQSIANYHKR